MQPGKTDAWSVRSDDREGTGDIVKRCFSSVTKTTEEKGKRIDVSLGGKKIQRGVHGEKSLTICPRRPVTKDEISLFQNQRSRESSPRMISPAEGSQAGAFLPSFLG